MRVKPAGVTLMGSRNSTMQSLADAIRSAGPLSDEIDRPVVDRTELQGTFDYTIEWDGRVTGELEPGADALPSDPTGTTFLQALREQLGLKLVSSKGSIRMLIVDHVERPSAN